MEICSYGAHRKRSPFMYTGGHIVPRHQQQQQQQQQQEKHLRVAGLQPAQILAPGFRQ